MAKTLDEAASTGRLQQELAIALFHALPRGTWDVAHMSYLQAGAMSNISITYRLSSGEHAVFAADFDLAEKWDSLREAMADESKGAWLSASATVEAIGRFSFDFDYDRRPFVHRQGDLFSPPSDGTQVRPSDDSWREDLRKFPRAPEFLPAWMVDLIDVADPDAVPATESAVIAAAKAAPIAWPKGLEFLRSEPVWAEMFDQVAAVTVRELEVDSATVRKLADPAADRGGWLDGLLQDVFGAVWDDIMGDRLDALWAGLERGGVVIGPADAEKKRDDLSDALGDVIAQQLTDRFGFAPEP